MKQWLTLSGLLVGCVASLAADEGSDKKGAEPMTFSDLSKAGVTKFVDKEFTLKTRFTWKFMDVKIPENPVSDEALRKKAGPLMVPFEGPEFKNVKGKNGMHVAESPDITKAAGPDGQEVYSFKGVALSSKKEYVVTARLRLRPSFEKAVLNNPAFVKQSDNPAYWSQTFELEILGVKE